MFPTAGGINLSMSASGQSVAKGIVDQIREVMAMTSQAARSAVSNIGAIYQAAAPKIPTAAAAPVSAAVAAMNEIASGSINTSTQIADSINVVKSALQAMMGPEAESGESEE